MKANVDGINHHSFTSNDSGRVTDSLHTYDRRSVRYIIHYTNEVGFVTNRVG
jgi:hypothetical protein